MMPLKADTTIMVSAFNGWARTTHAVSGVKVHDGMMADRGAHERVWRSPDFHVQHRRFCSLWSRSFSSFGERGLAVKTKIRGSAIMELRALMP
jgi:hypothetical protein